MSKPILVVMCGLQGSGKSTIANDQLKYQYNASIISSDEIRIQNPSFDNEKVFKELYDKINFELSRRNNCILDATNITMKSRRAIFNSIKSEFYSICYIVNTPYEDCLHNIINRNKNTEQYYVPLEAVKRYYYSFEVPFYEEGWNEIIIHNIKDIERSRLFINYIKEQADGFNQKNKFHKDDLLTHMENTHNNLKLTCDDPNVLFAASIHDIGKLYTQMFKDDDDNAHYYNHSNVGAYDLLCYWCKYENDSSNINDTLDCIFYVNYHMLPFNIQSEKSIKKWQTIFGVNKWNNLLKLHKADKFRQGRDE